MKFVTGNSEQIHRAVLDPEGNPPSRLDCIHMKRNAPRLDDCADLVDGENHASFIIRIHNGHQCGVISQCIAQLFEVEHSLRIDFQPRDPISPLLEVLAQPQNRGMFYLRGYDVALIGSRLQHSTDGSVIPLGAATREDDLDWIGGADQRHDLRSRFADFLRYLSTEAMNA